MIRSEVDAADGCLYLGWKDRASTVTPQEAAAAYQAHIADAGVRLAFIGNESPEVAAVLLAWPGFSEGGGNLEMSRPWPSGLSPRDLVGVRRVGGADEPLIYEFLKRSGLIAENRQDLQRIFTDEA